MKIGLWGTPQTEEGWAQVWELIEGLQELDISAYGSSDLAWAFSKHQRQGLSPLSIGSLYSIGTKHLPFVADLLLVWGGREALLNRLGAIARHGPTILLVGEEEGFPAIREEGLTKAVDQLLRGEGIIDSRMLIGARLSNPEKQSLRATNENGLGPAKAEDPANSEIYYVGAEEVVFQRSKSNGLLRIDLSVDGRPLTSYEGDGLVISTPTGSSARSLSAGGPLVAPGTEGLLVTPVASHALTARPILVPKDSVLEARVYSRSGSAFFRVDRSACPLKNDDIVTVCRKTNDLQMAIPAMERNGKSRKTERKTTSNHPTSLPKGTGKTKTLGLAPASTGDRLRGNFPFPRRQTTRESASPEDLSPDHSTSRTGL